MTHQKQSRSSALFLTELTLAILFFAAASAVCVQIFVKSHLMSLHSRQLNLAVTESASIAELIEASDSMEEAVSLIRERYPLAQMDDDCAAAGTTPDTAALTLHISYDKNLVSCSSADPNASLVLSVTLSQENRELCADLCMENIYTLHISHHLQRRAPHEP